MKNNKSRLLMCITDKIELKISENLIIRSEFTKYLEEIMISCCWYK